MLHPIFIVSFSQYYEWYINLSCRFTVALPQETWSSFTTRCYITFSRLSFSGSPRYTRENQWTSRHSWKLYSDIKKIYEKWKRGRYKCIYLVSIAKVLWTAHCFQTIGARRRAQHRSERDPIRKTQRKTESRTQQNPFATRSVVWRIACELWSVLESGPSHWVVRKRESAESRKDKRTEEAQ